MNTKTMRLPPRRISTTIASSNNNNNNAPKRKERESNIDAPQAKALKPTLPQAEPPAPSPAPISGHLLAGYLAHEFLTKGTLLGQPYTTTARSASDDPTVKKSPDRPEAEAEPRYEKVERYVEVADLLKTDGARLAGNPGIVNPTQLARYLQL